MKKVSPSTQSTEPIRTFLNWIEGIEIRNSNNGPTKVREGSLINGPYADIKELIGKISSSAVQSDCLDCH